MYLGEVLWIARKPVENAGKGWLHGSCIQVKIGFVALNLYAVQWDFLHRVSILKDHLADSVGFVI